MQLSVFHEFLAWNFSICQFFLWYCGTGYPPMSPSVIDHVFAGFNNVYFYFVVSHNSEDEKSDDSEESTEESSDGTEEDENQESSEDDQDDDDDNEEEDDEDNESSSDDDFALPPGPINLIMGGLPIRPQKR